MRRKDESRIVFSPGEKQSHVEIWVGGAEHTYRGCDGENAAAFTQILADIRDADVDVFIFLRQEYSWGRLLLTKHTFARLRDSCDAFPALDDHISSFAFKTSDRDEHFATYDRKVYLPESESRSDEAYHELCYLLRYPARHGRKSGCPFSIRQMALYHRFHRATQTSRWIFVQAPDEVAREVRGALSASGGRDGGPGCDVHRWVLAVAEQEWRDYVCYLDAELGTLEEKAFFVDVDDYSGSDYRIAFADSQKLQRLRRKLVKCKEILDCCLEVAHGCEKHWQDVGSRDWQSPRQDTTHVEAFVSRIKTHKRGVEAIQEHAEGTSTLLSQILNYRNEDMLVKSNDALNKSSDAMREIALAAKAENELMSALISKSQKDSHTVKVLTCIALIYLPASLVAEIFNSNLVQTKSGMTETAGSRLVLSKSFWLYPLITLGLMVLTFLPVLGLLFHDRVRHRLLLKGRRSGRERD